MKTFTEFKKPQQHSEFDYLLEEVITEEVHKEIQDIISSESNPKSKLALVTKKVRELIKSGQDTGLASDKPKKGSSRAYYPIQEPKDIHIDGVPTKMKTGLKIAFPGKLDNFTGHHQLLGEMQNDIEGDNLFQNHSSVLKETEPGRYQTNPNGIFLPVLSKHSDNHYLEVGHVDKFNAQDLRNHTKNEHFPKGLSIHDVKNALVREHENAHGMGYNGRPDEDEHLDNVSRHPYVESMIDGMHLTGMHPADIHTQNMGIWVHPVTGYRHPVVLDYGFSNDIAKHYGNARRKIRDRINNFY